MATLPSLPSEPQVATIAAHQPPPPTVPTVPQVPSNHTVLTNGADTGDRPVVKRRRGPAKRKRQSGDGAVAVSGSENPIPKRRGRRPNSATGGIVRTRKRRKVADEPAAANSTAATAVPTAAASGAASRGAPDAVADAEAEASPSNKPSLPSCYHRIQDKCVFLKDLPKMMFGFGDVQNPDPASVLLMDELVTNHLASLVTASMTVIPQRRDRLRTENFLYVMRQWPAKLDKCRQIIKRSKDSADLKRKTVERSKKRTLEEEEEQQSKSEAEGAGAGESEGD